jgi:hypothetical protein
MKFSSTRKHRTKRGTNKTVLFPEFADAASESPPVCDGKYMIVHTDAFAWLETAPPNSIEAVVTDPPYGLLEYTDEQLEKRKNGKGGVWRLPPSFDGCERSPFGRASKTARVLQPTCERADARHGPGRSLADCNESARLVSGV